MGSKYLYITNPHLIEYIQISTEAKTKTKQNKTKTKINNSFPVSNFVIGWFSTPYQLDRDSKGCGILLNVREDIPSNLLASDVKNHIQNFYVELNLRNEKWLISCSYNPNKTMICNHLDALSTYQDLHSTTYEKI